VSAVVASADRLLAGPSLEAGAESQAAHNARLGPLPRSGTDLIAVVERSGLLGRGGAGFPVGQKWRAVAGRAAGRAVVVANGAEGDPRSSKDPVSYKHIRAHDTDSYRV
jgi:NADH:ubiquinone oxidoreductase subunit F (NADH-binding)